MTTLKNLVNNWHTDKDTVHSYLDLYNNLLLDKKNTAKNVLEVGIQHGGSIKLWSDFFTNATVHGLDITNGSNIVADIKNNDKIILYTDTDAYNEDIFNRLFLNNGLKFDFLLDDGPQTLESMIQFINLYSKVMTDDGILIIEDVQDISWIETLKNAVPEELKQYIFVYDLRTCKGRYDDIVFSINKTMKQV